MIVTKSYTVVQTGVGKPDYSKEISSGETRPGVSLKYLQDMRLFCLLATSLPVVPPLGPWCWQTPRIPAGDTVSLFDGVTGIRTPVTVPQGYTLDIFNYTLKTSQDAQVWLEIDGHAFCGVALVTGGSNFFEAEMVEKGTSLIDPTGSTSYEFDLRLQNLGGAAMEVGVAFYCFFTAVGTKPLPSTKEVRCKFCGHLTTVPRDTSKVKCSKCGEVTLYMNLSKYRGRP